MHSRFVLLLLAALQLSYSCRCERPHIRYYSRWEKHRQPYFYGDNYGGSYHSDGIKPIHEDQHEDFPSRSNSTLGDEQSHIDGESPDSQIWPGRVHLHGRKHDGCEIFVNPIRPPHLGPKNKLQIEDILTHSDIGIRRGLELGWEGVSGGEYESNATSLPGQVINSQLGSSVSGGLLQDIQGSANSAINQQIGSVALTGEAGPGNSLLSTVGTTAATPILPFFPSEVELPISQPTIGPSPAPSIVAAIRPVPHLPPSTICIRHRLLPVPVRVVEECITNVPIVRKTVRHQVDTVTSHVPVTEKTVTQQQDTSVRYVPLSGKTIRNVVETRVRHIPVIKSHTRTVVEPYTVHVPVTIRFTCPVEESITKTVPVQEVRSRPVATKRTRLVPVIQRITKPIVEQQIHNVPVKKQYVRTVIEQRVRPVVVPCQPCALPPQPVGLPLSIIQAQDIPRILLSPYSDLGEASSTLNSQPVSTNSQLDAAVSGVLQSSENIVLSDETNEQIPASDNHHGAFGSQLAIAIPASPDYSGNLLLAGPIAGGILASSGDHSGIFFNQPCESLILSIDPTRCSTNHPVQTTKVAT